MARARRATGLSLGIFFALLLLALPRAVSADTVPAILDVRLDDDNHAVITWRNVGSQTSNNVKWTTDGALGATYRDGSYGTPLADCESAPRPNPSGDSQWLYGRSCKGDDVANAATRHVTREDFQVGVYYFQVTVAGKNIHETGASVSAVFHYSGVFKLTVTPAKEGGGKEETGSEKLEAIAEAVVTGKATVQPLLGNPRPVARALTIRDGDTIVTGASPVKLSLKDGPLLALDRRSTAYFTDKGILLGGRIWYSVKGRPRVFFKDVTAGGAGGVLDPRAATFTIQRFNRGDSARVRVYRGTVTVFSAGVGDARVRVGQGFETVLEWKHAPTKPTKLTPEPPFWK